MRKLPDSPDDYMNGFFTYEFNDGRRIKLDRRAVADHGVTKLLQNIGYSSLLPTARVDVMQHGRKVGSVPPDFDPATANTRSFLYDPREGDFTRADDHWVASNSLGPWDLDAVVGFQRENGR